MAVQFAPLFALETQFQAKNGRNLTGGFLRVFLAATDDPADTYSDYNGTRNPDNIVLNDDGRAVVICDKSKAYRLEVYDADGMLMWTEEPVFCSGSGGAGMSSSTDIISTDGTIVVEKSTSGSSTTFDIGLGIDTDRLNPSCLSADATPRNSDGKFVFGELSKEGDLLSVDNYGCVRCEPAWYHFTAIVELSYDQVATNASHQITLYTTLSNSVVDFDLSYAHRESIELSGDIHVVESNSEFVLGVTGLPNGVTASLVDFDIHAITGHEQSTEYTAGNGIDIADHVISADLDVVQHKLTAGQNITITGNVISAENLSQEQADWTQQDNTQPDYIKNKPDLSVYATTSAMETALAGKQNVISDLSTIRSGAAAGATALQPSALDDYSTTQEMNTALAAKQDVISDLSAIRSGAQAGATALQPSALDDYSTTQEMNTALAAKQDVISDLSTIRSGAALGATAVQPADMNTALAGKQDVISDLADIRSGAAAGATAVQPATMNTALAGKQDVISDLSDIRSGASAGATAVQPADMNTALAGKQDVISDLATIRSGAAAGATAVQPADMNTALAGKENASNKSQTLDPTSTTEFPSSAATASFVNSSVATNTATFRGNFKLPDLGLTYPATDAQIEAALDAHVWPAGVVPTNNDYVYVEIENPHTTGIDDVVKRFKFNGTDWHYEYTLNNSSFTAAEKAAIDSGIDSAKVASYDAHVANGDIHVTATEKATWNAKQDAISDLSTIRSGAAAGATAVQPGDLATVATTGAYSDLSGTPTIPVVDQTYNASSANAQSGVAVAGAISGKQDTISDLATIRSGAAAGATAVQPGDLSAVATTGAYSDLSGTPTIPTVDQSYNASSANAQSGVAVAQAIAAAPGTTYTAGDAISIDQNDVISVKYDASTLEFDQSSYTADQSLSTIDSYYPYALQTNSVVRDWIENGVSGEILRIKIPANVFRFGSGASIVYIAIGDSPASPYESDWCYYRGADVVLDSSNNVAEQTIEVPLPLSAGGWTGTVPTANQLAITFVAIYGGRIGEYAANAESGSLLVAKGTAGALTVQNPLPASASGDAAKVLTVDSNGDPAWAAPASATVDQVYNASSTNAQSGTAVAGAISGINQVPASTSSDADKVLTVDAQGVPGWANAQAPISAGDGIDITNNVVAAKVDGTTIDTNASGELTVIGGGSDGADWDAEQGEPGYIENKPVPKTLTAGTGISISENASTITISSSVTAPVRDVTVDGTSVVSNGVAAITSPTVDQTYDASSTNAQSGIAVASGISAAIAASVMPISVVAALPANPDPNTLYVVTGA